MAVFRVEKNSGYTVMSNHHLRNRALSLKAKGLLSYNKIVVFIDRAPAECYNSFRVLWIGEALLPQRRFLGGSNHSFFVERVGTDKPKER